jgi:hypothetical protein
MHGLDDRHDERCLRGSDASPKVSGWALSPLTNTIGRAQVQGSRTTASKKGICSSLQCASAIAAASTFGVLTNRSTVRCAKVPEVPRL